MLLRSPASKRGFAPTHSILARASLTSTLHRMEQELDQGRIVIVAGFQGVTHDLDVTTLGRGGSDTTAVAIAIAVKAATCEIYTDVDGIYTADPRVIPTARKLSRNCPRGDAGDGNARRARDAR